MNNEQKIPDAPKIWCRGAPPERIFKYCTRTVLDEHISNGRIRLGTLADFRAVYEENGSGYGDLYDGNETILMRGASEIAGQTFGPEGAVVLDFHTNAYVFSAAASYSDADHRRWFERQGCGYDVCAVFDGLELFNALATEIYNRHNGTEFVAARPMYDISMKDVSKRRINRADFYLVKNPDLAWEDEYRFVCVHPTISPSERSPLIVESAGIAGALVETIPLKASP
jgi:hypothetical protein